MDEALVTLTVEGTCSDDAPPEFHVRCVSRAVHYGALSAAELQYLIEALTALRPPSVPSLRQVASAGDDEAAPRSSRR